ncbi:MAG: hypothetical protein JOZ07_07515 [Solirubrobacterales bacterium]|nr:hypothetical protein [Solirubrobacterales bacterium]
MAHRLRRLAPLTGIAFAVLALIGFAAGPSTPGSDASGSRVIAYYTTHQSTQKATDLVFGLAFVLFVFFAAALRSYIHRGRSSDTLSTLAMIGAAMTAAGFMLFTGIEFSLADVPNKLTPSAAQALNLLDNDLFFPTIAGMCVFAISSGLAILRESPLPRWLGWLAIVIGILSVSPAFLPAVILLLLWTATVSIVIYTRTGTNAQATTSATTRPAGEPTA